MDLGSNPTKYATLPLANILTVSVGFTPLGDIFHLLKRSP